MEDLRIIFLDIDGVLNDRKTRSRSPGGFTFVDTPKIRRLKRIIDATDAEVVLSSDWRYDRDDPALNADFIALENRLAKHGIEFYGFTPNIAWDKRGLEIQSWLDDHKGVTGFVILDDRGDMEPNLTHLVQTKMRDGLTEELADKAIAILLHNNKES